MELESYFEFLEESDIRVKGTRIGIETILDDYFEGFSPEEIAARYRSLSLEQVYATITFYLHNRKKLDDYLNSWRQYSKEAYQKQELHTSTIKKRLLQLKSIQLTQSAA